VNGKGEKKPSKVEESKIRMKAPSAPFRISMERMMVVMRRLMRGEECTQPWERREIV